MMADNMTTQDLQARFLDMLGSQATAKRLDAVLPI